jgi:hypothetical protein
MDVIDSIQKESCERTFVGVIFMGQRRHPQQILIVRMGREKPPP